MSIARYLSKLGALLGSDGKVPASALATGAVTADAVGANTITLAKLARVGTAGHVLTSNGAGSDPSYQALPAGGVTSFNTRTGAVTLSATDVGTANAGVSVGGVGTYALMYKLNVGSIAAGGTLAGGNLAYASARANYSGIPSGTWRCMGYSFVGASEDNGSVTLWLRIS